MVYVLSPDCRPPRFCDVGGTAAIGSQTCVNTAEIRRAASGFNKNYVCSSIRGVTIDIDITVCISMGVLMSARFDVNARPPNGVWDWFQKMNNVRGQIRSSEAWLCDAHATASASSAVYWLSFLFFGCTWSVNGWKRDERQVANKLHTDLIKPRVLRFSACIQATCRSVVLVRLCLEIGLHSMRQHERVMEFVACSCVFRSQ